MAICMLPVKRLGGVTPEVTLINSMQTRKCASEGSTLALKSRPDLNRKSKEWYQWTHKLTCIHQKIKIRIQIKIKYTMQ